MDLIKIEKREGKETANARDIHEFLESKQEFSSWIKAKIKAGKFEKDNDFIVIDNVIRNQGGGRPATEYHITLRMASHLGMMENTDRGIDIRDYFYDLEMHKNSAALPATFAEALQLAADQALKIEQQAQQIESDRPAVEFHNKVQASPDSITIGELAKIITKNGFKIGRNTLFEYLRNKKYLMISNEPYQIHMNSGLFEVVPTVSYDDDTEYVYNRLYVTGKGVIYFCRKLCAEPVPNDNIQLEMGLL